MTRPRLARLSRIMCEALELHLKEGARPRVPDAGKILWRCFADLCASRRLGPAGFDPVQISEVMAWAALHRFPFEPGHVAVIRDLDRVWLESARAEPVEKPLTPEGFDMAFG